MLEIINVPQGKTARSDINKDAQHVKSIFTTGFATCNIVIFASKDKLSLTHADFRTTEAELLAEHEWVGNNCEIYIIHHDSHSVWKNHNKDRFSKCLPTAKTILVANHLTGIEATFKKEQNPNPGENTLPSWIIPHERAVTPDGKHIYHPDEYKFQTAHMIEEHFRDEATQFYSGNLRKTNVIFNSGWCSINPVEFIPRIGNAGILLSKSGAKRYENIEAIGKEDLGFIAHVSLYTNNYDIYKIFYEELMLFTRSVMLELDPFSNEYFRDFFINPPLKNKDFYEVFEKLFLVYKIAAPQSNFKKKYTSRVEKLFLYHDVQKEIIPCEKYSAEPVATPAPTPHP